MEVTEVLQILDSTVAVIVLVWVLARILAIAELVLQAMRDYHSMVTERLLTIIADSPTARQDPPQRV